LYEDVVRAGWHVRDFELAIVAGRRLPPGTDDDHGGGVDRISVLESHPAGDGAGECLSRRRRHACGQAEDEDGNIRASNQSKTVHERPSFLGEQNEPNETNTRRPGGSPN
jgi:hypothetical protein